MARKALRHNVNCVSSLVVMSGRTPYQLAVSSVEFGGQQRRGVEENVFECCRPTAPVGPCLIVRDAPDEALTKGLPLAGVRPTQRNGQAEQSAFPWRVEHDFPVVARRGGRTVEVGVKS